MAYLAEWLKKVVGIIIFAGFLEMLLPDNGLKGVTRMVLGLLVMMVLLAPLAKVFNIPAELALDITRKAESREVMPATAEVIDEGAAIRKRWDALFREKDQKKIKDKIAKALTLYGVIEVRRISLEYDQAELFRVIVEGSAKEGKVGKEGDLAKLSKEVSKIVYLATDLPEEQIEVRWDGRDH